MTYEEQRTMHIGDNESCYPIARISFIAYAPGAYIVNVRSDGKYSVQYAGLYGRNENNGKVKKGNVKNESRDDIQPG